MDRIFSAFDFTKYFFFLSAFNSSPGTTAERGPDTTTLSLPAYQQTSPFSNSALLPNGSAGLSNRDKDKTGTKKPYPDPFRESFNIEFNNSTSSNNIAVNIFDLTGRLLFTQNSGTFPTGNNTVRINVGGKKLAAGIYLIQG